MTRFPCPPLAERGGEWRLQCREATPGFCLTQTNAKVPYSWPGAVSYYPSTTLVPRWCTSRHAPGAVSNGLVHFVDTRRELDMLSALMISPPRKGLARTGQEVGGKSRFRVDRRSGADRELEWLRGGRGPDRDPPGLPRRGIRLRSEHRPPMRIFAREFSFGGEVRSDVPQVRQFRALTQLNGHHQDAPLGGCRRLALHK